ncbi:Protein APEM9 [Linum grandiflorum]
MDAADWFSAIWEEIDRSESYLVCSKYEEAASIASAVLKRARSESTVQFEHNDEFFQVKESAGMVLVQSLSELGRASEILSELKELFGNSVAIPAEVLLTGYTSPGTLRRDINILHLTITGSLNGLKEFLEDFLSKWIFVDGSFYVLGGAGSTIKVHEEGDRRNRLDVETFLAIVEVYAVTLLGKHLKEFNVAVSWLEKAALPEEIRQVLLRKLQSMYSVKTSNGVHGSSVSAETNRDVLHGYSSNPVNDSEGSSKVGETARIVEMSRHKNHPVWWFRCINLKLGNMRVAVTNGKIVVSCVVVFLCYVLKKKQAAVTRSVKKQVVWIKKSMVELWELAFSYQVNPLAALQPLPAATRPGP